MQAPQDPLAQLAPLRAPADPHWWPPAPGWWLLAAVMLLALTWALWSLLRRHRQRRYRRVAAERLNACRKAVDSDPSLHYASECNRILKTVALRSFPRRDVAALSGTAWLAFLHDTSPGVDTAPFDASLTAKLYTAQAPSEPADIDTLHQSAQLWIAKHRAAP